MGILCILKLFSVIFTLQRLFQKLYPFAIEISFTNRVLGMTLQISTIVMFRGSWIKWILENPLHFQSDYSNLLEIRKKHLFHFSVVIVG